MPDILLKIKQVREDIKGFLSNESVSSLFFEDTIHLKLFRILKTTYPKFHTVYSLQVKTGHDRKVIIPILERWAKFKLLEVIENYNNCRGWRINKDFIMVDNNES